MSRDTRADRDDTERASDHAAIDRLTAELLPALIAKLGATGLGELEVREGAWRVRLRRPGGSAVARDRRSSDRTGERAGERGGERSHQPPSRGHHHAESHSVVRSDSRSVATSPAVGIFQPRKDLTAGSRVRAGDPLGAVDMLGVAQEVIAPIDGIVGEALVEPGDAVEYGQELLVIEFGVPMSTNGTGA
jgi:biotin carboxyl carrier protein